MQNFQTPDEILDFAMKSEQEAHDFYIELAKMVELKELQEIILGYAEEELGHKKKIQKIKETRQFGFTDTKVQNLKVADYLIDIEPEGKITYQEALIIAMKKEKAAFKLYTDLASISNDPVFVELFQNLAQEEAKHKLRFELEYDTYILKDN